MSFELSTIDTQISSILSGISTIQTYLNEDVIPQSGFPAVTYQFTSRSGEAYLNTHNREEFIYTLKVWFETQRVGKSEAVRITQDIVSDLFNSFQANITLNSTVDFIRPMNAGTVQEISHAHGDLIMVPVELVCVKLVAWA